MTEIVGNRGGHRYTITVTGRRGTATITRTHHPDCPCHTQPALTSQSARTARRRKPTRR
ncbi:hypothetical protein ACF07S_10305 [Streptomyces sp. NPDC016640]|uniref:hypothetical protein n=1 Tax=Streptomyces sp. NPDC016640 TaxID=3364969 RepID=UPI0036FE78F9